jgi:DNA-binding winged helix-turn-helix (wHTH) protein/tetratricopeptide (TPR) repeat protein
VADDRIDLAHAAPFELGSLCVFPATRELVRGELREVIEPRVMQVLVALHRAGGAVVSKSDLAQSCWNGRIVGEDAINRVMSRLRKVQDGIAAGLFRVETVTKVGYRLVSDRPIESVAATTQPTADKHARWSRRSAILAGGGILAVAGGGALVWQLTRYRPPPEALALVREAQPAIAYGTVEQTATAISALQQATRIAPDWAAAWGFLALAYGQQAMQSPAAERAQLIDRSRAASKRAIELDPANIDARLATVLIQRGRVSRAQGDAAQVQLLKEAPDHAVLNLLRSGFLSQTGRVREAVVHGERAIAQGANGPVANYGLAGSLAAAGRPDEADAAYDRTFARWPRHYGAWFSRYKNFLYTGRVDAAAAMLANKDGRPLGISTYSFDICEAETRALASRSDADIAAAIERHLAAARVGVGYAQNAIIFAATTGRLDTAFLVAGAYFFDEGWRMPDQRYTSDIRLYSANRSRPTYFFFDQHLAGMRADARFNGLMERIGLEAYWRAVGVQPDYRAASA